jgi:putative DNA primase/helicase
MRRLLRTYLPGDELVIQELQRRTPRRGMRKRIAFETGVSESHISAVLLGKTPPSLQLARGLGFRLVKDDPSTALRTGPQRRAERSPALPACPSRVKEPPPMPDPAQNPLLLAALGYARRGWPVFPCNPENKQPLLAADRDMATGKPIKGSGGVSKATTDEEQIRAWWKRWPKAMIGLAMGRNQCFALDFDPRTDQGTGEVFTLERLKAETEAMIGCALPETLAAVTPSDGVHVYYQQPAGEPIRNRGNLPEHVDVRGAGGYVIAPPSVMADGRRYRWLRGNWNSEIAEAPEALIALLRDKGKKDPPRSGERPRSRAPADDQVDDAVRKYALAALDGEVEAVRRAPQGQRNNQLNTSALKIGGLAAAGALNPTLGRSLLEQAARDNGLEESEIQATLDSGWSAGEQRPRDLAEIAATARRRSGRSTEQRSRPPDARPRAPRPLGGGSSGENRASFRDGREDAEPSLAAAEQARFGRIAEAWLRRRIEHAKPEKQALTAIAWGAGRRCAGGLLDASDVKERIWPLCETVADIQHADIDQAIEDGIARGFDPGPLRTDIGCAGYPMTDFGIGERFRDRYACDFRFTTGKGWLGWDQRRWKVLDQDKDTLPAELIAAVMETIRAIQREANRVADTGIKLKLIREGKQERLDLDDETEHALDHWVLVGRQYKLYSKLLAAFGRQAETAGKPVAIANLAKRWLTVPIEDFDCEQLAINVLNGTLRFDVEQLPEGAKKGGGAARPASAGGPDHARRADRVRPQGRLPALRRHDRMGTAGPSDAAVPAPGRRLCDHRRHQRAQAVVPLGTGPQRQVDDDRQLVLGAGRL